MYRVEVDWAPPYELLVSLAAYENRAEQKTLELSPDWARTVRQNLGPELHTELSMVRKLGGHLPLMLLVRQCPGERDVESFLTWVSDLSVGELYERIAPELIKGAAEILRDLGSLRDIMVRLLTVWHERYFQHIDREILCGLRRDAEAKRALISTMAPQDLVEFASNGLQIVLDEPPEVVILVPQHHYRPWNLYNTYRTMWFIEYPADVLPAVPGEPPPRLLRLARALSDENRLRILRFLVEGPRSFTEIRHVTGLSKSTVHHHMVALRAAGLVRVRGPLDKSEGYTLRLEAIDELGNTMKGFLSS